MTDEEQIELLRSDLEIEACEPPASSVAALRAAVERASASARHRRSWKLRCTAAAGVVATVFSGSSAAFALSGAAIPRPLRVAMHAVGLPVDSVTLADAKSAESQLAMALRKRDTSAVDHDARLLALRLSRLGRQDLAQVDAEATALLAQADELDSDASAAETSGPEISGSPDVRAPKTEETPAGVPSPEGQSPGSTGSSPSSEGEGTTPGSMTTETSPSTTVENDSTATTSSAPLLAPSTTNAGGGTGETSTTVDGAASASGD